MPAQTDCHQNRFDDFFIDPVYLRFKSSYWNYRIRRFRIGEQLRIVNAKRRLEVGAGVAPMSPAKNGVIYTDLSPHAIAHLTRNFPMCECVVAGAENLPFTDMSFDVVVCSEVLEHITNDAQAISEMVRVLSPGGSLIITVPAHSYFYGPDDRFVQHVRRYDPQALQKLLESHGLANFHIVKTTGLFDKTGMLAAVYLFKLFSRWSSGAKTRKSNTLLAVVFPIYWIVNLFYTLIVWLESMITPLALTTVILVRANKR